jgi:hypothetical protein
MQHCCAQVLATHSQPLLLSKVLLVQFVAVLDRLETLFVQEGIELFLLFKRHTVVVEKLHTEPSDRAYMGRERRAQSGGGKW